MAKGRTLVRGTLLLTVSALALRGLGVLFHAYLAGVLGAEGMGLLQLVFTVGALAGTLGSSGSRVAVLQLASAARGRGDPEALSAALRGCLRWALAVSSAAAAALLLLAEPLSRGLLHEVRTAPALRIFAVFLPCAVVCGVLRSTFTACGRVRELVAVDVLERLVCVGLTALLLRAAGRDLRRVLGSVLLAGGLASLLSLILLALLLRRDRLPRTAPDRGVARLCVPLALNDYMRAGLGSVEQFLIPWGLGRHSSPAAGLAAYGIIGAMVFPVLKLPEEMLFSMSDLLIAELSRLKARRGRKRLIALVNKSLGCAGLLAAVTAAALYFGGPAVGRAVFRSPAAGDMLRLFSPMVLFLYLDAMTDGLLKGLGQQLWLVRYNSLTNVIDVLGLFTLLPRFGIWGYIATYAASHLVNFFLSLRRLLISLDEIPGERFSVE